MKQLILSLLILAATAAVALSANRSTTQAGDLSDPATWGGTLPSDGDRLTIKHYVTLNSTIYWPNSPMTMAWNSDLQLLNGADLTLGDFETAWNYIFSVAQGAHFTVENDATIASDPATPIIIDGHFTVNDNLTVSNGTLNMGATGLVTVQNNLSNSNGTINLDGTLTVQEDFINNGNVALNVGPTALATINGSFINKSSADLLVDGGTVVIAQDFDNQGDGFFEVINGGEVIIGGNMVNTGGSAFIVDDGSINIQGDFDNKGGSEVEVGSGGTMDVDGDLTNTGGGDIAIDGSVNVDGTLTNKGGGVVDGSGTLTAGEIIGTIGPGLNVVSTLYAIASGNWNDGTIWSESEGGAPCNCTPASNKQVTIAAYSVSFSGNEAIPGLHLTAGAELTIQAGAALEITGNFVLDGQLVLESTASQHAQLLDNGSISGTGSVTVYKTISGATYHYIASPLQAANSSLFATDGVNPNPNFYFFDESVNTLSGDWNDGWQSALGYNGDIMVPGLGYAYYFPNQQKIEFTGGQLNTGTLTQAVTNSNLGEPSDGWNLVGNPYPSAIDANAFLSANSSVIDGTVYFWQDGNTDGTYTTSDYATWNGAGAVGTGGQVPDGSISAYQGFFVHRTTTTPATDNVEFNQAMRMLPATQQYFKAANQPKDDSEKDFSRIKLSLTGAGHYNELLVATHPEGTTNFDKRWDSRKLKGSQQIAFYSMWQNEAMAIQTLPQVQYPDESHTIALGMDVAQAGEYTVDVTLLENWAAGVQLMLEDTETGQQIALNASTHYTFQSQAGEWPGRFLLHIMQARTSGWESPAQRIQAFATKEAIHIRLTQPMPGTHIRLINLQGQLVQSQVMQKATTIQLPAPTNRGVYVLQLSGPDIHETCQLLVP